MRERVLGTLRRIYGPPYPWLAVFVAVPVGLILVGRLPWILRTMVDLSGILTEECPSWLETVLQGVERVIQDPRAVVAVFDVPLVRFFAGPFLFPLSLVVGLRLVSVRTTRPPVRLWGAVWAAAGAFGLAWTVIALAGGRPGRLAPFVEPVLWAGGAAFCTPWLLSMACPGRRIGIPVRRLPALTVVALLAGHYALFDLGPVGQFILMLDADLYSTYQSSAHTQSTGVVEILRWTRTVTAIPLLLLFATVALRDLSIPGAARRMAGSIRTRPRRWLLALGALLLAAIPAAVASSAFWFAHYYAAESRAAAIAIAFGALVLRVVPAAFLLYFAARTVWFLTEPEQLGAAPASAPNDSPDWQSVHTG